jgi:serine/threonine protein kinase
LKIANLGFDIRGDVKLFDFGLSRWMPPSKLQQQEVQQEDQQQEQQLSYLDENFRMSSVATKVYMAPEVRARMPYSAKADVYSFGIVLWEMLALCDPTWCRPPSDRSLAMAAATENADNMPLCGCWPLPLQTLLKQCVSATPTERPSFTKIRAIFRDELLHEIPDETTALEGSANLTLHDSLHMQHLEQSGGELDAFANDDDDDITNVTIINVINWFEKQTRAVFKNKRTRYVL